jgi:predicted dehydrogenase
MQLNVGIIGAGNFSAFAAKAFLKIPGIKLIAVTDVDENKASRMANELNAVIHKDLETFFSDTRIDLVYIATPPFLHYQQSKMALLAGKHVICEKPAALKLCEAEELSGLAQSLQLLYVVNLMQRYNGLYDVVKNIIREKVFGNFLHGFFENYASDENLGPDHWFWDESKSGGIFIEHGVHFFDMFAGWLGEGILVNALQLQRPGIEKKIIDRVQATVLYDSGIVNFYHGFDQPKILDRQELRLQFERGEVTLFGWIPVRIKLHGLFQKQQFENLHQLMGEFKIVRHNEQKERQKVRGRFCDVVFDDHSTIEFGNILEKQNQYQQMLGDMIVDQWHWIEDHKHICVIDSRNAIQSLKIAGEATHKAQNYLPG